MKVAVIGGGGREHALVWKLKQSTRVAQLFCLPGNAGIRELAICVTDVTLASPWNDLIDWCAQERIDLVVVGPEAPLVAGIADALSAAGIPCFGVSAAAAQLEGSKTFAREITQAAGVPSHEWRTFEDAEAATNFYRELREPWWIKADGLAAGKGAVLPGSREAGVLLLRRWLSDAEIGDAGRRVVIEEPLAGRELSVIALVSGTTVRCLTPSQDHKRLKDGDDGPNTGGMGAFAPLPDIGPVQLSEIERSILVPTLRMMKSRGIDVRGVLYAGIMMTGAGPRLLEFNVRFGDPEAQVLLWMLDNSLVDLIEATIRGSLHNHAIRTKPGAAAVVVCAAAGYPTVPRKGDPITGLQDARESLGDLGTVFHAGTVEHENHIVTSGGRVLGVTAWGESVDSASARAYSALEHLRWDGIQYRTDIGRHRPAS